ncbi:hypothetical protein F4782DRAFT_524166, partial [Xylaria castorea]
MCYRMFAPYICVFSFAFDAATPGARVFGIIREEMQNAADQVWHDFTTISTLCIIQRSSSTRPGSVMKHKNRRLRVSMTAAKPGAYLNTTEMLWM